MKTHFTQSKSLLVVLALVLILSEVTAQFTPGEGGALPAFPVLTAPEGTFPGFIIKESGRRNNVFYPGTYARLYMECENSENLETDSLILQSDATGSWQDTEIRLSKSWVMFDYRPDLSCNYRLRAKGGKLDGFTSNVQYGPVTGINSYMSQSSLDESMYHTGIMAPWVGRGLAASFEFKDLILGGVLPDNVLTYQWYRVNPKSYEMTPIPGATDTSYATTSDDTGYHLMIQATGDETTIGGFYKFLSSWDNVIPNKAVVGAMGLSGFTLNLFKSAPELLAEELELTDDEGDVPILAVRKGDNDAMYHIDADLKLNSTYYLRNTNPFWRLCTEMRFGEPGNEHVHIMEMVSFTLTLTATDAFSNTAVQTITDRNSGRIYFSAVQDIAEVTLYSTSGKCILNLTVGNRQGEIETGALSPGVYFIRYRTETGIHTAKVIW